MRSSEPAQNSVKELGVLVILSLIVCFGLANQYDLKGKSVLGHVPVSQVIWMEDVSSIHRVPLMLKEQASREHREFRIRKLNLAIAASSGEKYLNSFKLLAQKMDEERS